MSFSALKKLIKKQSMHRFYTDVDAQALTPKFAAQFVATLGLTGAMALGTTSLVAAAINDDTISNNLDRRDIPSNDAGINIAQASGLPAFNSCSPNFYLSQADDLSNPSQLNDIAIDLNSTPAFSLATIPPGINSNTTPYNAIGYNQADDNLYGVENDPTGTNADHNVVRIGSDGNTEIVRTIPDPGNQGGGGSPRNYVVGDVVVQGGVPYLYAATANLKKFYRVNLADPLVPAESVSVSGNVSFLDFAFHPTNGRLYGIQSDTHNQTNRLVELTFSDPVTAIANTLTLNAPLPGNRFGGVFFDGNGRFYAYHNGDSGNNVNVPEGNFYAIDIDTATGTYTLTHMGEAANVNQNDGARCASAPPPAVLTSGNSSLGGQVWNDINFNGIQDAGEPGYDNVVVELFTTDGVVQDTQTTSGGGFYNFTNVTPDDYRLQFELPNGYIVSRRNRGNNDEIDSDVNRVTGKTARITVATGNNIDNLDAGISLDTDSDTIPDVIDGTGDRDGDGTLDYQDVDPAGYFYDEATGEIIAGGLVSVSGPGGINLAHDGNATGYYQWFIDGTAGTYNMAVTPPPGYQLSAICLEQATFDPTGGPDPTVVGNYEDGGNPGFLTGNECDPFYLSFDLADGDPFVINNNIPFKQIFDYGDAPDTYGTDVTAGNSGSDPIGASHNIINGIHLGATAPDAEDDASTPLDGSGDGAEDDGITLVTLTEGDTSYTIPVGNITATGTGTLHVWLDFDKSGTFEPGEYTSVVVTSDTPAGDLTWSGITAGAAGDTYARFRYTSDASINANTPGGAASDGEVEDYQVAILPPLEYAISGQVRNDTDNDGDLNDTDSGISGVTVTLFDDPEGDGDPTGSTQLATTTTDGSGNYSFADLAPGNYIVIETDPNGYTSTNDSDNFNNNRITVNLTNADDTGNDFLDSNTPVPPPGPQACGTVYDFTWGAGGAVWNVGDTSNTYTNVDGSGVDVTLVQDDPFNQNIDNDNSFPGRDPFFTQTNGAYGSTYLTWAMTAQNSNQIVSFIFTFSPPILVEDLQVIDLDGTNAGSAANSFQDEIAVSGSLDGVNVPLVITPESAGTMTVNGQSATGSYTGGNLSHTDPRGHLIIESTEPINTIRLDYSNGPADADGQSNGHAIAIDQVFQFCDAPTRTISGQVREDVDNDGDLNDADSGIETVTVQLFSDLDGDGDPSDGTLVDTQITDASGNFSFTNVNAGHYVIVETNSAGYTSTADSAGSNDDQIPVSVSTEDSTGNIFLDNAAPIASDPDVLLVKRITALNNETATTNGDSLAAYIDQDDIVYPYDDNTIPPVSDPNNVAYDPSDAAFDPRETNQWPTPLSTNLRGGIDGGDVMPNDEIEYTIYYLSSGNTTAESVLFCDYVPTFTSFIPNAYGGITPQATGGIGGADLSIELFRNNITDYHTGANDGDSATYFAPGTDPATSFPGIDCDGDSDGVNANPNGAVVVNLGDLPDATTDATRAYGYVRFRTRVR